MPRLRSEDNEPQSADVPPARLVGRHRTPDWVAPDEVVQGFDRAHLAYIRQRQARQAWCDERGIRYRPFDDMWRRPREQG